MISQELKDAKIYPTCQHKLLTVLSISPLCLEGKCVF